MPKKKLIKTISTFFFTVYLPLAPGTWGSLAGVLVYLLVRHNICLFLGVFTMLFFLGLYAAGKDEDIFGRKDDRRIVIDEVCGMLLLFLLIPPYKPYLITGFIAVLYALYHAVPEKYVTLSWTVVAVLYFLMSFLIKNIYIASSFHLQMPKSQYPSINRKLFLIPNLHFSQSFN